VSRYTTAGAALCCLALVLYLLLSNTMTDPLKAVGLPVGEEPTQKSVPHPLYKSSLDVM
jgi:hypothetical protein